MELSDLSVFYAVVEEGGVTSAARVLHRVPSNITTRIQKLESELGKKLFIREKNRLRVSPAGEQLLPYATKILALAGEAVEQLNQQKPQGALRLGTMEAVAASRLSAVLMDYHCLYPDVDMEVKVSPTGVLIEQVLAGDLDIALVADPVKDPRLHSVPVFSEKLVLVSDLQQKEINAVTDLGSMPTLLGFSSRCVYRARLAEWVKAANVVAKVVEINSYHALLNCVTAGMGVGLVPEKLLEFYPFKDGLMVHQIPVDLSESITHIIWREDSVKPSITAFAEALMKTSNINE